MKNEKKVLPATKVKKTVTGSNPVNKFKKGQTTTVAEINNVITSAVENVKSRSGKGLTDEGSVVFYDEER